MRIRREPVLVAVLVLLSVSAISGSVLLAARGLSPGRAEGVVARLPDVLFSREQGSVRIAPVKTQIEEEIEETPDPGGSPSPSAPSPRPQAGGPAPSTSEETSIASSAHVASMTLDLSGTGSKRPTRVVYVATLTNTGGTTLDAIRFLSHVPDRASWEETDSACLSSERPVRVVWPGSSSEVICVPGGTVSGSSDESLHGVDVTLGRALKPGESVTVSFTLKVIKGAQQLTNHAHAESDGVKANSPAITTSV